MEKIEIGLLDLSRQIQERNNSHEMDIIGQLVNEHKHMRELYQQFLAIPPLLGRLDDRQAKAEELKRFMCEHTGREESVLYPFMAKKLAHTKQEVRTATGRTVREIRIALPPPHFKCCCLCTGSRGAQHCRSSRAQHRAVQVQWTRRTEKRARDAAWLMADSELFSRLCSLECMDIHKDSVAYDLQWVKIMRESVGTQRNAPSRHSSPTDQRS